MPTKLGHATEAVEVVRTLGYAVPTDHVEQGGLPLLHFVLAHERGELPPVELHWRVHCRGADGGACRQASSWACWRGMA